MSSNGPIGRIAVVGPCASGKSTLVRALQMHGYDAHVSSQEHSGVATLWRRNSPALLIALQADLETVRLRRRDSRWRAEIWRAQQERLSGAFAHAAIVIDTSARSADAVVNEVLRFLEKVSPSTEPLNRRQSAR